MRLPTRLALTLAEVAEKSGVMLSNEAGHRLTVSGIVEWLGDEFAATLQTGLAPSERARCEEFAQPFLTEPERRLLAHARTCAVCLPNQHKVLCEIGRGLLDESPAESRGD